MLNSTILFIVGSVVLFLVGLLGGYLLTRESKFSKASLRLVIGVVVTLVWTISIIAEIVIPAYTVSMVVHGIMGAVVGYLYSDNGFQVNIGQ